jgi:hypothetical protein
MAKDEEVVAVLPPGVTGNSELTITDHCNTTINHVGGLAAELGR